MIFEKKSSLAAQPHSSLHEALSKTLLNIHGVSRVPAPRLTSTSNCRSADGVDCTVPQGRFFFKNHPAKFFFRGLWGKPLLQGTQREQFNQKKWGVKRHFGRIDFLWNKFRMPHPCHISNPEFGGVHLTLKLYGDTSTGRGSIKMWRKLVKLHCGKTLESLVTLPFYPSNCTER